MHSIWSRLNSVFAFTLSTMSVVTVGIFLSTLTANRTTVVELSANAPRVRVAPDYAVAAGKSDHGAFTLNIEADVSPVFNWNVKQLFMYLVAEYKTPVNEINQVVIWDKILLRAPRSVIIEKSANMKYFFIDYGQNLRGHENVTLTLNWNIIPYAGYLPQAQGQGSYQVKFPKQYVSGRF